MVEVEAVLGGVVVLVDVVVVEEDEVLHIPHILGQYNLFRGSAQCDLRQKVLSGLEQSATVGGIITSEHDREQNGVVVVGVVVGVVVVGVVVGVVVVGVVVVVVGVVVDVVVGVVVVVVVGVVVVVLAVVEVGEGVVVEVVVGVVVGVVDVVVGLVVVLGVDVEAVLSVEGAAVLTVKGIGQPASRFKQSLETIGLFMKVHITLCFYLYNTHSL